MFFQENETTEFKEIVVEDIKKEVIAFANIGVEKTNEEMLKISNMIRDSIKPDVTMFVHYDTEEQDGKKIIVINVQRGTGRPYYIAKKGLRPEGVYIRQGTSSVPATDTAIRHMIKETDGDSFEEMRSLEQNLTFQSVKKEFALRNLEFGPQQMQTLKILNSDGIYTNLGLLLSEQCIHTIKAACFQGTDQSVFQDRREFSGSLMQQLNDVYSYIDMHNQIRSTFEDLRRIDILDYPKVAVREALLNLLVHRDYAFRASALISIYTDRIEFVSIGGLLPGIALDDIMSGVSVCRNQNLANIFYRLELIEAYGTGMRKIMGAYRNMDRKPLVEITSNSFKIILPNSNVSTESYETDDSSSVNSISQNERKILDYVKDNAFVTRADVEKLLEISASTASRLLKHMVEKRDLLQQKKGKKTKYTLPE